MGKLFNLDSPLWRFVSKVGDLIALNFMFIITSIPIITIGASTTALYSTTLKVAKKEEVHIIKGFIKEFKENFKQGTIIWLIMLLFGVVLFLDFRMINILPAKLYTFMNVMLVAITILYVLILTYIFAYISRFKASVKLAFKNSLAMSILNLQYTIFIIVFNIGICSIILWNPATLIWGLCIWLLIGFSFTALINSFIFTIVFSKYEVKESNKDVNHEKTYKKVESSKPIKRVLRHG